jgi:hypothetical protein
MDDNPQQSTQPPQPPTPSSPSQLPDQSKISGASPSPYVESIKKNTGKKPFYKRTSVRILFVIFLLIAVPIAYLLINNMVNEYVAGNQSDSDIMARLNKHDPGVVSSVEVVKKSAMQNCTLFCRPIDKTTDYEYDGYFTPTGAKFKIPFDIWVSTQGNDDTVHMDSYDFLFMPQFINRGLSKTEWKDFVTIYNSLGQKTLNSMYSLSFNWTGYNKRTTDMDTTKVLVAGYKYDNLYEVCASTVCGDYTDGVIPHKQTTKQGFYIFYYDDTKDKWVVVTDDGQYFMDWVNDQGARNIKFTQIDWTKSPIKPYIP